MTKKLEEIIDLPDSKEIIKQESKKVGFFEKLNPFRGKFK